MKFEDLVSRFAQIPCFDLEMMDAGTSVARFHALRRWEEAGKIWKLRRGLYTLSEIWRKKPVSALGLAGYIQRSTYISMARALSFFGLVPDVAYSTTCVTLHRPAEFTNHFGQFVYRKIRRDLFNGFFRMDVGGESFFMALPEKAIVDYWWFSEGEWTPERQQEMRWQNLEILNLDRLRQLTLACRSPRISHALETMESVFGDEMGGDPLRFPDSAL